MNDEQNIYTIRDELNVLTKLVDSNPIMTAANLRPIAEKTLRLVISQWKQRLHGDGHEKLLKIIEMACETECKRDTVLLDTMTLSQLINIFKKACSTLKVLKQLYPQGIGKLPSGYLSFDWSLVIDLGNKAAHGRGCIEYNAIRAVHAMLMYFVDAAIQVEQFSTEYCIPSYSNNLPRISGAFIGRNEEIDSALTRLLDSRDARVCITGIGGVGKSALAVEIARRCLQTNTRSKYDYAVWFSAKNRAIRGSQIASVTVVDSDLGDLLKSIIRVVKPDQYQTAPERDIKQQIDTAIEILRNNRVLLVVDNMETVEDARIPSFLDDIPEPSKALITSREAFVGAWPMRLSELSDLDASALVSELCRDSSISITNEQILQIVSCTGGIPLAIVWAIEQVAATGYGVDDVIQQLSNACRNQGAVILEFLFDKSFSSVSTKAHEVLFAIHLCDCPIDEKIIMRWTGMSAIHTRDALVELYNLALVTKSTDFSNPSSINYSMHSLTQQYVRQRLDGMNALAERRSRALDDVLTFVEEEEPRPEWPSTKTIDRVERYLPLVEWAIYDSYASEEYFRVCKIMRYVGYSLHIRGYVQKRVDLGLVAVDSARKLGDLESECRHLICDIAWVYFTWHDWDKCDEYLERGYQLALVSGLRVFEAIALRTKGLVLKERIENGHLEQPLELAEEILESADRIFLEEKAFLWHAATLGSLGSLARDRQMYEKSEKLYKTAIDVLSMPDNSCEELISIQLQKLSKLFIQQGRYDEARDAIRKTQLYLDNLKRPLGRAYGFLNKALLDEECGSICDAYKSILEAEKLFMEYGSIKEIQTHRERIASKIAEQNFPRKT